jgi:hypothetical protein
MVFLCVICKSVLMIAEFCKVLLTLYYISHLSCQRQLTTKWKLGLRKTTSSTQNECDFLLNKRVPNGPPYISLWISQSAIPIIRRSDSTAFWHDFPQILIFRFASPPLSIPPANFKASKMKVCVQATSNQIWINAINKGQKVGGILSIKSRAEV